MQASTDSAATSLLPTNTKSRRSSFTIGRILCLIVFLVAIYIISYFILGATHFSNNSSVKSLAQSTPLNTNLNNNLDTDSDSDSDYDAFATTSYYKSDGEDDQILEMPSLDYSTCDTSFSNCSFRQYSGYLLSNTGTFSKEIHYWFIEADVEEPLEKPLFIWTNGGPGCSGMDGLLTEHGPWRVGDDLSIAYNEYAWTTEVNMVYLEQPYGVGFSAVDEGKTIIAGDENSAEDMDAVIRNFLTKFPRFADSDVYTTAESWGGHYVPMTAWTILNNNAAGEEPYINYKGFLLGNPYTDQYENAYGFIDSLYGHGLMRAEDYDDWKLMCWDNEEAIDSLTACSVIYNTAYMSAYNTNVYALDWPQCLLDEEWSLGAILPYDFQRASHIHRRALKSMENVLAHSDYSSLKMHVERDELAQIYERLSDWSLQSSKRPTKNKESLLHAHSATTDAQSDVYTVADSSYVPCIEYDMNDWLNRADVQFALNVKPMAWEMCSDAVWYAWPETDWETFMQTYYADVIETYSVAEDLKLAIYSGDDDSVCGQSGTQFWLNRWDGYSKAEVVDYVPWRDEDGQLGGYHSIYRMDDNDEFNALHFLTVRTAGHMVPTTEPQRALTLLRRYLYELENYSTE